MEIDVETVDKWLQTGIDSKRVPFSPSRLSRAVRMGYCPDRGSNLDADVKLASIARTDGAVSR